MQQTEFDDNDFYSTTTFIGFLIRYFMAIGILLGISALAGGVYELFFIGVLITVISIIPAILYEHASKKYGKQKVLQLLKLWYLI